MLFQLVIVGRSDMWPSHFWTPGSLVTFSHHIIVYLSASLPMIEPHQKRFSNSSQQQHLLTENYRYLQQFNSVSVSKCNKKQGKFLSSDRGPRNPSSSRQSLVTEVCTHLDTKYNHHSGWLMFKLCPQHHQQLEPVTKSTMDPCFHVVYVKCFFFKDFFWGGCLYWEQE